MFNVGNTVVVACSNDEYAITKDGSIGIIIQVNQHSCRVQFIRVAYQDGTTREAFRNENFEIDNEHLEPTEPVPVLTPLEKVCAKIKQMEERRKVPPVKAKKLRGTSSCPDYIIVDDIEPTVAYQ